MQRAYVELHRLGIAHSVEAWQKGKLVGGLYGVSLGRVFFGESMFSRVSNASKVAFVYLVKQLQQWQYALIDCQVSSEHLKRLGATDIKRKQFIELLAQNINLPNTNSHWQFDEHFSPFGSIAANY